MNRLRVDTSAFGSHRPGGLDRAVLRLTRALPDTRLGLRLAILIRRITTMRLGARPLDTTLFGVPLRLYPLGNGCEKLALFTPQMLRPRDFALIEAEGAQALAQGRRFSFVDIGANVGVGALRVAARLQGAARILVVEPSPGLKERLAYNLALNPGYDIRPLTVAVAERDGVAAFFLDPRDAGANRIGGRGEGESVEVRARPLLDILVEEGFEGADLLKLDTQGSEDLVLEPFLRQAGEAVLPRLLMVEDHRRMWGRDLAARLAERGYGAAAAPGRGCLLFRRGAGPAR